MIPDPYRVLGVAPNATESEIRRAFRRLALKWHPDRNGGSTAAEAQFKLINAAYQTLRKLGPRAAPRATSSPHARPQSPRPMRRRRVDAIPADVREFLRTEHTREPPSASELAWNIGMGVGGFLALLFLLSLLIALASS